MGVPAVRLSEKSRKRLGLVSAVANFICVIPSLVLFGIGGYIQVGSSFFVIYCKRNAPWFAHVNAR